MLALLTEKAVLRRRYLRTGSLIGKQPKKEELDRVCQNLRNGVGTLLQKAGVNVRFRG